MNIETISASEYRKMKPVKKSKYNNRKIEYRGEIFDSQKELDRWIELKIMEKAGEIKNLKHHVSFELLPPIKILGQPTQRKMTYEADFLYFELLFSEPDLSQQFLRFFS